MERCPGTQGGDTGAAALRAAPLLLLEQWVSEREGRGEGSSSGSVWGWIKADSEGKEKAFC